MEEIWDEYTKEERGHWMWAQPSSLMSVSSGGSGF